VVAVESDYFNISSVGAVFNFYGGTVNKPSKFWLDLDLEWLLSLFGRT